MAEKTNISKLRLYSGGAILIIGFCAPLFIPFVTATEWSIGLKTTISGLLAFGIPEVFMLIAIAVLGKEGFDYVKSTLFSYLKRFAPPDRVSISRYRVGLVFFISPIILGFCQPYLGNYLPFFSHLPTWYYIISDGVFFISFFILGGGFWDKFRSLFIYNTDDEK